MSKSENKKQTDIQVNHITDRSELIKLLSEQKTKLLQVRIDVKMGKEKNNQLVKVTRRLIAQAATRLRQLEIINQA